MKRLLTVLCLALFTTAALAQTRPFNVSITPGIAVYDRTDTIEGLTLSLWGENPQTSLALGLVNGSTDSSAGLSLGLILNYADSYTGLQWAPVNYTKHDFLGWQGGAFVNYTGNSMRGLQTGLVNYAGHLTGLQFGVLNIAATADFGLQIGVLNIIPPNRWFSGLPDELAPGMILVNWHF